MAAEALEEADLQGEGSEAEAVEAGEKMKLHALQGAASRYGTFLLYCAPLPRPQGQGLRGTCRSKKP